MAIKLRIFIINGEVSRKLDKIISFCKLNGYQRTAKELIIEKNLMRAIGQINYVFPLLLKLRF